MNANVIKKEVVVFLPLPCHTTLISTLPINKWSGRSRRYKRALAAYYSGGEE